jgi:hypothetical protein
VCLPAALRGFKDVDRVPGTGRLVCGSRGHRCTSTIVTHQVGDSGLYPLFLSSTTPAKPPSSRSQRYTDEAPPSKYL